MIPEFVIDVVTLIDCFWFYNLEVISSVVEGKCRLLANCLIIKAFRDWRL